MIELPIKKKYFDAILELKKPFELRHKPIKKGTIVKLIYIEEPTKEQQERLEQLNKNSAFGWKLKEHYIIFESGECKLLKQIGEEPNIHWFIYNKDNEMSYGFSDCVGYSYKIETTKGFENIKDKQEWTWNLIDSCRNYFDWFDNFCWDYINKKPTYLIEIAKILEVK